MAVDLKAIKREALQVAEELKENNNLDALMELTRAIASPESAWESLEKRFPSRRDKKYSSEVSILTYLFTDSQFEGYKSLKSTLKENIDRYHMLMLLCDDQSVKYRDFYVAEKEILDAYALTALVEIIRDENDPIVIRNAKKAKEEAEARKQKQASKKVQKENSEI